MGRPALHDTGFWAAHVSRQQASQLSVREYCRREGLETHQFYNGRKRVATGNFSGGGQSSPPQHASGELAPQRHANTATKPLTSSVCLAGKRDAGQSSELQRDATDHVAMVVIQLNNGEASIHVPADRHDTIEAVLRMSLKLGEPEKKQSPCSGFRSIVVRS